MCLRVFLYEIGVRLSGQLERLHLILSGPHQWAEIWGLTKTEGILLSHCGSWSKAIFQFLALDIKAPDLLAFRWWDLHKVPSCF